VTPLCEFRDVGFAYPMGAQGRAPFEIRGLSFSLSPGEVVGLIGPNAAGKTTVIRLLSRVLEPSRGEILIAGQAASRLPRSAVARQVAVVPQDVPHAFPYTVEQLVLMGRFPHAPGRFFESREDVAIAREAMAITGVEALAAEPMDRLSGGERQRVVIARALAQRPRLLVLDEPTAHLDLRYQAECVALLRRLHHDEGLGILLVSHDLNLAAEVSDRLLLMAGGAAVSAGTPEDVMQESVLEAVYGCPVVVDKHPATRRPTVNVVWPDGR
jgi:ABC-type cobalamin/Fe3+-siderophores transport system ATPase subunit